MYSFSLLRYINKIKNFLNSRTLEYIHALSYLEYTYRGCTCLYRINAFGIGLSLRLDSGTINMAI